MDRGANSGARWRVGIDTGGTFADIVAWSAATGTLRTAKLPRETGPERLAATIAELGVSGEALVVHGTTQVTNAILEGDFARTALVTTRGFADVLAIGRQGRDDLYDLRRPARLPAVVPPELVHELDERCGPDGSVTRPLEAAQLEALARWVACERIEAVAVCLLHAYANPGHELRVGEALAGTVAVSLSHQVSAEAREYERAAATALNAAVQGATREHIRRLAAAIARELPGARLFVVQSTGAMLPAAIASRSPLATVMSGPAAGVAAVSQLARRRGVDHAVAFDMGGTSTDVALIVDGVPAMARSRTLGGHVIRIPSVGVESIAVGGGSIVAIDDVGALTVGPHSAGAHPGPACYGHGGKAATITDAALLCGLIGAGGGVPGLTLRRDLAEGALGEVAQGVGLSAPELAWRALDVAQSLMSRALSNAVTRRGHDLRRCTLVAYGGGGPVHAGPLAARIGVARVLVPALAPVFSALGCCLAEVGVEAIRTHRDELSEDRLGGIAEIAAALAAHEADRLGEPADGLLVQRRIELRYRGQNAGLLVDWPEGHRSAELAAAFHAAHRREYGFVADDPIEVLAVACRLVLATDGGWPAASQEAAVAPAASSTTLVLAGGVRREVPVVAVGELAGSAPLAGPAIVASRFSSITVWLDQVATLDDDGAVLIEAR